MTKRNNLRDPAIRFACERFANECPRLMMGWTYKRLKTMADDPWLEKKYRLNMKVLGEILRALMREARRLDLEKARAAAIVGLATEEDIAADIQERLKR